MRFSEWMELREVKDACYRKVKARFNVFPSAYASGALVQCRKKGAKNWGVKKESALWSEVLKDERQYSDALNADIALHHSGVDPDKASSQELASDFDDLSKAMKKADPRRDRGAPVLISDLKPQLPSWKGDDFDKRLVQISRAGKVQLLRHDQALYPIPRDRLVSDGKFLYNSVALISFKENAFNLEKERGLRGWFDRNHGKGWIDCKASKKGSLAPCGRKKAGKGTDREYPACRPNLSACNSVGKKRKKGSSPISWKKD